MKKSELKVEIVRKTNIKSNSDKFISESSDLINENSTSLKEIVENYLCYYAKGETHTARAKRYDLSYFLKFLAQSKSSIDLLSVSDWTAQATKDFIDYRLSLGESPATVSRRLATLKHLGRTLAERARGYINPAREIKGPVLQVTKPKGLSELEISFLFEAMSKALIDKPSEFITHRNCMLLKSLLATGLRADEVRVLTLSQISADISWLKNVRTKGKKYRNVYIEKNIRDSLKEYLALREQALIQHFKDYTTWEASERYRLPVFISFRSCKRQKPSSFGLSPKTIWRIISAFGKAAQVLAASPSTNLHPHKLRHTFAHGLLNSSKDVRLVAQALGHSDVRTTMRYTERTEEQIAAAIERVRSS